MQKLGLDPAALENAAGRAKSVGKPKAVSDLADLVESLDAPLSRMPVVARAPMAGVVRVSRSQILPGTGRGTSEAGGGAAASAAVFARRPSTTPLRVAVPLPVPGRSKK